MYNLLSDNNKIMLEDNTNLLELFKSGNWFYLTGTSFINNGSQIEYNSGSDSYIIATNKIGPAYHYTYKSTNFSTWTQGNNMVWPDANNAGAKSHYSNDSLMLFGYEGNENGHISYSTNFTTFITGYTWTGGTHATGINDFMYDGTNYYAVGYDYNVGKIAKSSNGINWTTILTTGYSFMSCCYANNLYVAHNIGYVSSPSFKENVFFTSTDGTNWTRRTTFSVSSITGFTTYDANNLYYGNGYYATSNNTDIMYSSNGISWSIYNIKNKLNLSISPIDSKMIFCPIDNKWYIALIDGSKTYIYICNNISNWSWTYETETDGYIDSIDVSPDKLLLINHGSASVIYYKKW